MEHEAAHGAGTPVPDADVVRRAQSADPIADEGVPWPESPNRTDGQADIVHWDAAELSVAIRTKVVSCEEVMTAYLDHIEELNPAVNAIVSLRPRAELLAEAREKDARLREGTYQGWMHGFPHAVKDLADVRGIHTSHGLLPPSEDSPVPAQDALFVSRLRAAGAVFIGKTNTPQLGLGSQTYNDVFGTTTNAYDQTRTAGGSSGGAAVAVALRMLPVADGSDFMGSLRNPPGWNNVFGLRPSFGRIPHDGEQFVNQGGVNGPIARSALDLALLLGTMAGYSDAAPLSIRQDPATFTRFVGQEVAGRRVAWLGDLGGYLPMDADVKAVTTSALEDLERLGMSVSTIEEVPGFDVRQDLWRTWLTYRHWLSGMAVKSFHDDESLRHALKPEAVYELDGLIGDVDGGPVTAVDVYRSSEKRSELYAAFRRLFQTYDYVVLPTAQVMPFEAATPWPTEIAGVPMTSYHRWMEVTTIGTMIGAPTLAMPAGFSPDGLPIGLQVIGRNHDEASLLTLAHAWEQQTRLIADNPPPLLSTKRG